MPANTGQQPTIRPPTPDHLTWLEGSVGMNKAVLEVDLGGAQTGLTRVLRRVKAASMACFLAGIL
jgi:hypothetical protein